MGFSLHIQRVDGRQGDLPTADIAESMRVFDSIPWEAEVSLWEALPAEQREECRPLLQIFDDSGHSLHITAHSEDLIALAYNYPSQASGFGVSFDDEEGYIGTDQFPRSELATLLECFYSSDRQAMFALLGRFPAAARFEKPQPADEPNPMLEQASIITENTQRP